MGGVLLNRFYRQQTGWDMIPNREFWLSLPGLVWDGNKYTFEKLRNLWVKLFGSYETV